MLHLNINPEYPYVYETHFHTRQGSACARNTGAESAEACKKAGYTGACGLEYIPTLDPMESLRLSREIYG